MDISDIAAVFGIPARILTRGALSCAPEVEAQTESFYRRIHDLHDEFAERTVVKMPGRSNRERLHINLKGVLVRTTYRASRGYARHIRALKQRRRTK